MLYAALVAGALFVGLLVYPTWRLARRPAGTPGRIRRGAAEQPLVLCLGDSITHGNIGGDWVGGLRARLGSRGVLVANGGKNGEQAWSVAQRLDVDVGASRPSAVVLLIGSNDVMAAERPDRAAAYVQQNKLPRTPDLEWSVSELSALVDRLRTATPHLALCTIPPLGADPDAPIAELIASWNSTVRTLARAPGVTLLDVHEAVAPLNEGHGSAYVGRPADVMWLITRAVVLRYAFGRSWDSLATAGDWGATVDGIHLSDAGAARVGGLVAEWVDGLDLT